MGLAGIINILIIFLCPHLNYIENWLQLYYLHQYLFLLPFLFFIFSWKNPNGTVDASDFGRLDIGNYNVPREGNNLLGHVGYSTEQFYSESGEPNTPQRVVWVNTTPQWLSHAGNLEVRHSDLDIFQSLPLSCFGHCCISASIHFLC